VPLPSRVAAATTTITWTTVGTTTSRRRAPTARNSSSASRFWTVRIRKKTAVTMPTTRYSRTYRMPND